MAHFVEVMMSKNYSQRNQLKIQVNFKTYFLKFGQVNFLLINCEIP